MQYSSIPEDTDPGAPILSLGLEPGAGQARGSVVVPTMSQGGIQSIETIWTALSSTIPIASFFGLHLSQLPL